MQFTYNKMKRVSISLLPLIQGKLYHNFHSKREG